MGKGKPRHEPPKPKPGERIRLFTNEFKKGDEVSIIRTEHGWFDGGVSGIIVAISDYGCTVRDVSDNNHEYFINHPRDICKRR